MVDTFQQHLADRARAAVAAHAEATGVSPEEPLNDRMIDLLTNLRHLAVSERMDWLELLARADTYFTEEATTPARRVRPLAGIFSTELP